MTKGAAMNYSMVRKRIKRESKNIISFFLITDFGIG
jgi:hypothetical protein